VRLASPWEWWWWDFRLSVSMSGPLASTSNASSLSGVARPRPYTTSPGTRPPLANSDTPSSRTSQLPRRPRPTPQPASRAPLERSFSEPEPPREGKGDEQRQSEGSVDRIYDLLMREEVGFIGEMEKMLQLQDQQRMRKTKALHSEWESEVYDRVQEQVLTSVNARSAREVSNRGAKLMQSFIDVTNKKAPHGVFRDIILPQEYDPMIAHTLSRITYKPYLQHDPCKLELRKHAPIAGDVSRVPEYANPNKGGEVPRLTTLLWDKLEATPYGRLGKVAPRLDADPYFLNNRISSNEYVVPRDFGLAVREMPRGKRCGY